jgi:CheY-like chemotaxis protein
VRQLVCHILSGHGYTTLSASSGVEALELWRDQKKRIDLVLTDVVMPHRMSGRQLADKLHADDPRVKIIFVSGYGAEAAGKDLVLRDGVNFLQKPFEPRKLATVVRDCLDAA